MESRSRFAIGLILLAVVAWAISVLLAAALPPEGWVGHAWQAAAAVLPPTAIFGFLAIRAARRVRSQEEEEPRKDAGRTERAFAMKAEDAPGLALHEMERIFNATADAMRVVDTDFNVLRVNRAHTMLSGSSGQETTGQKCHDGFRTSLCGTSRCAMKRILGGEEYAESEVEMERADGRKLTCALTATPLCGPDGNITGIVESIKDITELSKAREHLQHSQLLASLGEMTAGIAHEVNNPLGSILLYSELLMAGDTSPQTKSDLRVIHDEAKRAARIMSNLLVYGRRGKSQLRRLDLHRVLKKLLQMREYAQKVQDIETVSNLAEGPLLVKGDSSQLNQLLMNLVLNAEESLRASGGGRIVITTAREGGWARISVADNGSGIPPENLTQVFFPFFTTKEVGGGPGLGLSTCYGIVTEHNGLIRADNNDMGGATFVVELPLARATERRAPRETSLAGESVA